MSNSALLAIPEVGDTQNNKAVTVNNMLAALEQASNAVHEVLTAGGTQININEATFTRHMTFVFDGVTANIDVTFPHQVGGASTNRFYVVHNHDSAQTITVKDSTEAGLNVVVAPDTTVVLYQLGINIYRVADVTPTLSAIYPADVGVYLPGKPADADVSVILRFPRACTMADNFAGSYGYCTVNPTATATFDVLKNGTSIGSVQISTGGVFTFSTTGSGLETFAAGDRFTITAPTPQDATLEDVSITFFASRTG